MNKKYSIFSYVMYGITILSLSLPMIVESRWSWFRPKNKKTASKNSIAQQIDVALAPLPLHSSGDPKIAPHSLSSSGDPKIAPHSLSSSGDPKIIAPLPENPTFAALPRGPQNNNPTPAALGPSSSNKISTEHANSKTVVKTDQGILADFNIPAPDKNLIQLISDDEMSQGNEWVKNDHQNAQEIVQTDNQNESKNNQPQIPAPVIDNIETAPPFELQQTPKVQPIPKNPQEAEQQQEQREEKIEFQFEDADLSTFVNQMGHMFKVEFITDEIIQPLPQGVRPLKGNKISFKTNEPLGRQQAWNLFLTFLEIAGFAVIKQPDPKLYRIQPIQSALKAPIRSFIGVDVATLPDNDELIRYVYFIENSTVEAIGQVVEPLKSSFASLIILKEHKAFILVDKAYNIKMLMKIVKELDKVSMPQSMSVLRLKRTDAQDVHNLYMDLMHADSPEYSSRLFSARKHPSSLFFPENVTMIPEPRTNSLVLLGSYNAIKKIEDFIIQNIDVDLQQPYSPLYTLQLKYADAESIAKLMNDLTKFGKNLPVGQNGGVRDQDRYLKDMVFTAEPSANRIIIKGNYEDYLMARDIIEKMDEQQPQVGIEVLIIDVTVGDNKQLGAQIRSKADALNGLLGNNVKFQTSGFNQTAGIVANTTADRGVAQLLGNLIQLATGLSAGNTVITLGSDAFGVWGIFQALQTISNAQLISNPFLVATNKTPATVSVGETRRVQTGSIVGTQTTTLIDNQAANLSVKITPQINSDGMIILELTVDITNFSVPNDDTSATTDTRKIETKTIVADGEVLALGGLIRNTISDSVYKVPILGDIPILGWLFKNRSKAQTKENLLILISTKILKPEADNNMQQYTQNHVDGYYETLNAMTDPATRKDPVSKMFFAAQKGDSEKTVEDFIFERHKGFKNNSKNESAAENTGNEKNKKVARHKRKKEKTVVADNKKKAQSPVGHQQANVNENQVASAQANKTPSSSSSSANSTNLNEIKLENSQSTAIMQTAQDMRKYKKRSNVSLTKMLSHETELRV